MPDTGQAKKQCPADLGRPEDVIFEQTISCGSALVMDMSAASRASRPGASRMAENSRAHRAVALVSLSPAADGCACDSQGQNTAATVNDSEISRVTVIHSGRSIQYSHTDRYIEIAPSKKRAVLW